jgi:hypothetical protein
MVTLLEPGVHLQSTIPSLKSGRGLVGSTPFITRTETKVFGAIAAVMGRR